MVDVPDPLLVLHETFDQTTFSIWSLLELDILKEFLDVMFERVYSYYQYLLEKGIGLLYFICGAEFATPPMVSPDRFEILAVPYLKKLVNLIKS